MKRKSIICLILCLCFMAAIVFTGCGADSYSTQNEATQTLGTTNNTEEKNDEIDYMVLVNKTHKLPEDWEEKLETVHMTNSIGDDVEVEKKPMMHILVLNLRLKKRG